MRKKQMDKLAILFPGQGSQYVGMGETFYNQYDVSKKTYEEASDYVGFDLAKLCFKGPVTKLYNTEMMQLAVVTTNLAIARAYQSEYGFPPQFCYGHSVGEYSALVFAGAFSFEDAIKLLKKRGELVTRQAKECGGQMTVVEGVTPEKIQEYFRKLEIQDKMYISAYNTQNQLLVSGHDAEMDKLQSYLLDENIQITPMQFSPPFHSELLKPIADEFCEFAKGIRYYPMRFPVILNTTAAPSTDSKLLPQIMSQQLHSSVLWKQSVDCSVRYGTTLMIEMGPKILTGGLVQKIYPEADVYCYGQKRDRESLSTFFSTHKNLNLDKPNFLGRCLAVAVSTKNRGGSGDEYDQGVLFPYREIKELQRSLQDEGKVATNEQMNYAYKCLMKILKTKCVPEVEIENWMKQMKDETGNYYIHLHNN